MGISRITLTEGVAVISIENVSADINFMAYMFEEIKQAGVNVDMISQTAPKGMGNSLCFSVVQGSVADLLRVTKRVEERYPRVRTMVSLGNAKLTMYGEDMPDSVGIVADVFAALKEKNEEVLLVTTSDVDISIVVQAIKIDELYEHLKETLIPAAVKTTV